jgi:hypothetical protein
MHGASLFSGFWYPVPVRVGLGCHASADIAVQRHGTPNASNGRPIIKETSGGCASG